MSKEKQIEDMAKTICKSKNPDKEKDCRECVFDCMCDIQDGCEALFEAGYRRASYVAEEIFAEIGGLVNEYIDGRIYTHEFCTNLAELKKKYTEDVE